MLIYKKQKTLHTRRKYFVIAKQSFIGPISENILDLPSL
jgi:hypothetical protein